VTLDGCVGRKETTPLKNGLSVQAPGADLTTYPGERQTAAKRFSAQQMKSSSLPIPVLVGARRRGRQITGGGV